MQELPQAAIFSADKPVQHHETLTSVIDLARRAVPHRYPQGHATSPRHRRARHAVGDQLGLAPALLVLAIIDALRLSHLPSPRLQRQTPGSLALGRWSEVRLQLSHDFNGPVAVEIFDHVPQGLSFENLPQVVELQPGQYSEVGYRLRPLKRGHFSFEHCEINLPSPFGLWTGKRLLDVSGEIRVYPDFAKLYGGQLLAVDNWLSQLGVRQRQRRGQGQEFHQLREFREGDSLRQIDWKATARQRTPIAREYEDERDQQIMFMLDCGRQMRSQDGELSHFDHALNACLLLSHVALRQGDAVGLSTFAVAQPRFSRRSRVPVSSRSCSTPSMIWTAVSVLPTIQPRSISCWRGRSAGR